MALTVSPAGFLHTGPSLNRKRGVTGATGDTTSPGAARRRPQDVCEWCRGERHLVTSDLPLSGGIGSSLGFNLCNHSYVCYICCGAGFLVREVDETEEVALTRTCCVQMDPLETTEKM